MKNQTPIFETVQPHPEPVIVADLLADIEGVVNRHVVLKPEAATALAVWILHTYVFELRDTVAYVAIESPEKRCGKTTLLSVLAAMAHRPLIASNLTIGALFSVIDVCRPTLFIDEADTFLAGNGTMRGIINSGNTWRSAYVLRLAQSKPKRGSDDTVRPPENGESGFRKFSCWCPKVIAMIGQAPDTIADRSIVVPMSRKLTSEACAPLTELKADDIKAKCVRFALDFGPEIAGAGKIRGQGLNDRAVDTFDPLYVIARMAGEGWEQKLHAAALALSSGAQEQSSRTELIKDILSAFMLSGQEKLFSRDLADILRNDQGRKTLSLESSSLNEFRISQILRPYGIRPRNVRIGSRVGKGYDLMELFDAFKRYIPKNELDAWLDELQGRDKLYKEAAAEARRNSGLNIEEVLQFAAKT